MNYRPLGRTGWSVSEVSFGAWAIGGTWGPVDDAESLRALNTAIDGGVNFIDTADVYGDGRSERLIAEVKRSRKEQVVVATKAGRRLTPHTADGYTKKNLKAFVERSLKNLAVDALDLLQLHCPPPEVYSRPEVFGVLDELVREGRLKFYGISVETVDEAMRGIQFPNVQSVQIIFNCFRHKPAERFFDLAKLRRIGILARVPLASGLLTGRLQPNTEYTDDDHRKFNRLGAAFDAGETFSGLGANMADAFAAVEALRNVAPPDVTLAQFALKWILMFDAVTCVIPGAKTPAQAAQNLAASDLQKLTGEQMQRVREAYEGYIRRHVQDRW